MRQDSSVNYRILPSLKDTLGSYSKEDCIPPHCSLKAIRRPDKCSQEQRLTLDSSHAHACFSSTTTHKTRFGRHLEDSSTNSVTNIVPVNLRYCFARYPLLFFGTYHDWSHSMSVCSAHEHCFYSNLSFFHVFHTGSQEWSTGPHSDAPPLFQATSGVGADTESATTPILALLSHNIHGTNKFKRITVPWAFTDHIDVADSCFIKRWVWWSTHHISLNLIGIFGTAIPSTLFLSIQARVMFPQWSCFIGT